MIEGSKFISVDDAITTAWMVLEGLGYRRKENPQLSQTVTGIFETAPAADVRPVVLCRDCVNYGEMLSGYDHRLICHKFALTTKPNFYCACGERRNFGTDMREES